jgi:DNA-binding NtrC family response regulator
MPGRRPRLAAAESGERGLLGQSPAMRRLRERIGRAGATEATVLIQGERGTGKELVAEALVAASRRRAHVFVKVNCAALPDELLASELFGHERGAFTGAVQRAPGLLAAADGGTVFLDEVGDLSPRGQAMLLRFLQEREVRPVGSVATTRVDVRVIAATNRDLGRAVARGEFRADLHDRLAEVVLEVPPLRARREDIPRLAEHFLSLWAARHGLRPRTLTPAALRVLGAQPWPGNVRQLGQVLSRALVFGDGPIRPEDLELTADLEWPVGDFGLPEARLDLREAGPAPPVGDRGDAGGAAGLGSRRAAALAIARRTGRVRRADLRARFGISGEAARRELAALVRDGRLRRAGAGRGSHYLLPEGDVLPEGVPSAGAFSGRVVSTSDRPTDERAGGRRADSGQEVPG